MFALFSECHPVEILSKAECNCCIVEERSHITNKQTVNRWENKEEEEEGNSDKNLKILKTKMLHTNKRMCLRRSILYTNTFTCMKIIDNLLIFIQKEISLLGKMAKILIMWTFFYISVKVFVGITIFRFFALSSDSVAAFLPTVRILWAPFLRQFQQFGASWFMQVCVCVWCLFVYEMIWKERKGILNASHTLCARSVCICSHFQTLYKRIKQSKWFPNVQ